MAKSKNEMTEHQVLKILRPYIEIIVESIHLGMQNFMQDQKMFLHKYDPIVRAGIINNYIKNEARRLFEGMPNTKFRKQGNLVYLLINGQIFLRFKKLKKNLLPSNQLTYQSLKFARQDLILEQDNIPGLFPEESPINIDFSNINIGYRFDSLGTKIEKVYLTCQNGFKSNKWKHIIFEAKQSQTTIEFQENEKTQTKKQKNVRIRKDKRKEKVSQDEKAS